jgi:hypothetical protein
LTESLFKKRRQNNENKFKLHILINQDELSPALMYLIKLFLTAIELFTSLLQLLADAGNHHGANTPPVAAMP